MSMMEKLINGYQRFYQSDWEEQRTRWEKLSQGQSPQVMVIACSDSRVDPSKIFDVAPGELFMVRNVANLVPPFETDGGQHGVSAAIEFAVTQLNIPEIIVMGHAACGGVHASLTRRFSEAEPGHGGFIHHWIDILNEARDKIVKEFGETPEAAHALELETIRVSIANLRGFPFVKEREESGRLKLQGAYFSLASGQLFIMDEKQEFIPAASSEREKIFSV